MSDDFKERLQIEADQLLSKLLKLDDFIAGEQFSKLPNVHKNLLEEQADIMGNYLQVLQRRIVLLNTEQ